MSVSAFLVIPSGSPGPAIVGQTVTDKYFSGPAFAKATVIEVSSFAFGVENATTIGSTSAGAAAGKAKFSEFTISKSVDKSSPSLFAALGAGSHFNAGQLYLRKSGSTDGKPYLAFEFQAVFVTKLDWSGSDGDDAPEERVTFAFGALEVAYRSTNPDGSPGTVSKNGWSQMTNTSSVTDNLTFS